MYLTENLRTLRKAKGLTQEEVAARLGVTPQSVSKWERGDTYPDITLLPALSNLFETSIDTLVGMDKINDEQRRRDLFTTGHQHLRSGDVEAAITLYSKALKTFPNDTGIMSDLAMALAISSDPKNLERARNLAENVLNSSGGIKVQHTTRAALCFIYLKSGEREKAIATARSLPHLRESREKILEEIERNPDTSVIDAYLRFIAIGEIDDRSSPTESSSDLK